MNKWKTTYISLYDSKGGEVPFDKTKYYSYVTFPKTSYKIVNLTICAEYVVKIRYNRIRNEWSDNTEQNFWMTSKCP